ncbi:MAG: Gfo/Idh/MocA family oxidoreductase [Bryobacterales bacterium]|nr:Gfo/Idh/MocA family oxidoreductase [Bryobacterales bacterium]
MQKIQRRTALAATAGILIVKPETAFGYQANSKIHVGVIGAGNRGAYDADFFSKDPRAEVAALCDLYPDQLDKAKTKVPAISSAKTYKDYTELLAHPGLDAVQITTPVYLHPEHFTAAVKAGKHIYCEKPAGASVAGVKMTLAAAKAANPKQVIFFGFQQRWSPEYQAAEKILRTGQIGELVLMRSEWMVGGIRPGARPQITPEMEKRAWYPYREKSGDFIVEQDCHGVDVLNWFAQARPVSAIGGGGKGRRKVGNNLDHVNVTYTYPNGLCGYLHGTQLITGWGEVREQFFGETGALTTHRRYYEWHREGRNPERVASKREITIDAIEQFLAHILEGKQKNMAFDACDSTLTSLLGRLAVDTKRVVTWDELMASE